MPTLPCLRLWILLSALATVAGWVLSAAGMLNTTGYAIAVIVGLSTAVCLRRELFDGWRRPTLRRLRSRFQRPFPMLFLVLATLVGLGGALHAPNNYDGLTYRVPRVLCWLADGHWSWLHTDIVRMNDRSCGFEWLMAPVLVFTHSLRFLFVLNFIPFLLMPGLIFSVFTRLGVAPRAAAVWMWLVPTGYGYLLQAGSIGNDAFAAAYALASVDFALRAAKSRSFFEAALSAVAVALLGGAKPGNLPLMLPWLLVFLPVIPVLLTRPAASLLVALLCSVVSFLPTAYFNFEQCGDWTGFALEPVLANPKPWVGLLGNSMMFLLGNFVPPLFPLAQSWNAGGLGLLPGKLSQLLSSSFQPGFHALGEIPIEETAGLGFGLCLLLLVSWLASSWRKEEAKPDRIASQRRLFLLASGIALVVFFAKSGMSALPRLILAYYPLLIPALLTSPSQAILVRKSWWRRLAVSLTVLAVPVVILTPARPLWPANYCLADVSSGSGKLLRRVKAVYATYGTRADTLAPIRAMVPPDCEVIGFLATEDDSSVSLWQPFGSRRVEYVDYAEPRQRLLSRGIRFLVVNSLQLRHHGVSIAEWLKRYNAEPIGCHSITAKVSEGPQKWYLVRLRDLSPTHAGSSSPKTPATKPL